MLTRRPPLAQEGSQAIAKGEVGDFGRHTGRWIYWRQRIRGGDLNTREEEA